MRFVNWPGGYIVVLAIVIMGILSGLGGVFGADARSFDFEFVVRGYEEQISFVRPSAIVLDTRSESVYVADSGAGVVGIFNSHGMLMSRLGREIGLKFPCGVAVDAEGNIYISEESSSKIKVVKPNGEVADIEMPVDDAQKQRNPGRMAVDRNGSLYVVDREAQQVLVFDKKGSLKFCIGGPGEKRGLFRELQDVAVDRHGRVYTLDAAGTPVQMFDSKGKYMYRFGFRGSGEEDIGLGRGLFVDRLGQVWVVDGGQHCLKAFDRSGQFLRRFGFYGPEEGYLYETIDAEMDDFGRVYVLEYGGRRVQVFSLSRPFEPLRPSGL